MPEIVPTSSTPFSDSETAPKENLSLNGYTPPPAPVSQPSSQELPESPSIPLPLPIEMEGIPSFGKSKPTSTTPVAVSPPTSPQPPAHPVLGLKGLECFVWSAAHDSDDEFQRLYGARVEQMIGLHIDEPEATEAIKRLKSLQ